MAGTGGPGDTVAAFRARLKRLHEEVWSPTYRRLAEHADREGDALATSTTGTLLNGPGTPRWETVATFIRACARHARAHRLVVPADTLDVDRWHADYRRMENMLADAAAAAASGPGSGRVPARTGRLVVPAQLPADLPTFAGRAAHLADLDRLLNDVKGSGVAVGPGGGRSPAVVISALAGTAGVGKTALAVHWAHRVRGEFPDGQLYVNLRGFDPGKQAMTPDEAVRGFLDALQVSPQRIPIGLDAQAALYRSLLAGRRMLVVLDNARDPGQVRPLLPGASGCLVVVTSRNRLDGLVALDGARPLALDLLSTEEARQVLAARLGADRVTAEADAVVDIIASCARLPLALAIVAGRAATHPQFTLAALAAQLRQARGGLGALAGGDDPHSDLRAVFSWSYHTLTPAAARLFRLLGIHPGPDTSTPAAASLTGLPAEQTWELLADLTRANLLTEHTPGRFTVQDLLRAYATEQAHTHDTDDERRAATHRLLDHYLHTAHTAALLLNPTRDPITLTPPRPGVTPEHPDDHDDAMAWFATEHPALLAAVDHAAATGFDTHTWQLAWSLVEFLDRRGHWHHWAATQQAAISAARRLADPSAQAYAHRILGRAYLELHRYDDAYTQLRHALDLYGRTGDQLGQAYTHISVAVVCGHQDRPAEAVDHGKQALHLFQAAGHQRGQGRALNGIGWFQSQLGEHEQALNSCQQALTLQQELGDPHGEAGTWDSLGYAHHHLGHHPHAITCYQHALRLYRNQGDRYFEAETLTHLGDTHHAGGDSVAARDAWHHALAILADLDHPDADQIRTKLHDLDQPATPTHTT
jgi:tetratricopeptide (TPR) repeat protein